MKQLWWLVEGAWIFAIAHAIAHIITNTPHGAGW